MNAVERLLQAFESRGLHVVLEGEGIVIEADGGAKAPPDLVSTLKELQQDVVAYLHGEPARSDVRRVGLCQLDRILEVEVPWYALNLLIVPGCRLARELRATDKHPGRVWCACEVLDLLLLRVTPDEARRVAEAKLAFDGALVRCQPAGTVQ